MDLDPLDIKILGKICFEFQGLASCEMRKPSTYSIAKSMGFDAKTARSHIKRIEDEFIKGYQVMPNLNVLGLGISGYGLFFRDPALKERAFDKLVLLNEAQAIYEFMSSLMVHLLYRGPEDLDRGVALLKELGETEPVKAYDLQMPPVKTRLSLLDWSIIKSLRHDATKPVKSVADELKVTSRTVRNRLERMIQANAIFMVPVLNSERVTNLLLYWLLISFEDAKRDEATRRVIETFQERTVFQSIDPKGAASLILYATEMGEPEENYIRSKSMEGVSEVHMDFLRQIHYCPTCIDKLVDDQISLLKSQRRI